MPRLLELFCGTKSVGRAFEALGWEVVSVDILASFDPTIVADIKTWDPSVFPVGHFAAIHASPPCTEYSAARTTAKRPRDLEGAMSSCKNDADHGVFETLGLDHGKPLDRTLAETTFHGPLEPRMRVISYCKYGLPYRKHTSIWTNLGEVLGAIVQSAVLHLPVARLWTEDIQPLHNKDPRDTRIKVSR
jgi:hypothetical protein